MATKAPGEAFGPSGAALWTEITGEFELSVGERLLLTQACRVADRLDQLHEAMLGAALVLDGKVQPVTNPLIVEARQQAVLLSRLVASLRVPEIAHDGTERRPQRRGSSRRAYQPRQLKAVQ